MATLWNYSQHFYFAKQSKTSKNIQKPHLWDAVRCHDPGEDCSWRRRSFTPAEPLDATGGLWTYRFLTILVVFLILYDTAWYCMNLFGCCRSNTIQHYWSRMKMNELIRCIVPKRRRIYIPTAGEGKQWEHDVQRGCDTSKEEPGCPWTQGSQTGNLEKSFEVLHPLRNPLSFVLIEVPWQFMKSDEIRTT